MGYTKHQSGIQWEIHGDSRKGQTDLMIHPKTGCKGKNAGNSHFPASKQNEKHWWYGRDLRLMFLDIHKPQFCLTRKHIFVYLCVYICIYSFIYMHIFEPNQTCTWKIPLTYFDDFPKSVPQWMKSTYVDVWWTKQHHFWLLKSHDLSVASSYIKLSVAEFKTFFLLIWFCCLNGHLVVGLSYIFTSTWDFTSTFVYSMCSSPLFSIVLDDFGLKLMLTLWCHQTWFADHFPTSNRRIIGAVPWLNLQFSWWIGGFLSHRATPSHHPFVGGIFPIIQLVGYTGTPPPFMEPPNSGRTNYGEDEFRAVPCPTSFAQVEAMSGPYMELSGGYAQVTGLRRWNMGLFDLCCVMYWDN